METASPIHPRHRDRLALTYIRQSTQEQVRTNIGSTEVQRRLADRARELGWPDSRIEIINELGHSGSIPGKRREFRRMRDLMVKDLVGIVIVSDISRLGRNLKDFEDFLVDAEEHDVLLDVNGKIYDPASDDLTELLELRMPGWMAWIEQKNRTRNLSAAKRAKVKLGFAVSPPDIGYVPTTKGKWAKDDAPEVSEAISRVFRVYRELRSVRKVRLYHKERGLLFPRRVSGQLVWEPITEDQIIRLLRQPNYTGNYYYCRTKLRRTGAISKRAVRPRSEWLVIANHHDGYITLEEWEAIQKILDQNRPGKCPPILGGAAHLQGLLWCDRCDRRFKVRYERRVQGVRLPAYACHRASGLEKLIRCTWVPAERLDTVVVKHVLTFLSPPGIAEARAVIQAAAKELDAYTRERMTQLQSAEDAVDNIRRHLLAVDPARTAVHADLSRQLEEAIVCRDVLRRQSATEAPEQAASLTEANFGELLRLSGNTDAIWHAPTTQNEDRKRLLHTVLSRVVVRSVSEEWVDLDIVWVGGVQESLRVVRSRGIDLMVEKSRNTGLTDEQIAAELHKHGVTGRAGGLVTRNVIRNRVTRSDLQYRHAWVAGLRRIRELALMGLSPSQILQELQMNGPQHWRGKWTLRIVLDYLRRLRQGVRLHGVPLLSPDPKSAHCAETEPEAMALMERRRDEGRSWRAISDELNANGYRPAKAERFTPVRCTTLYAMWRRRGKFRELAPDGGFSRLRHSERRCVGATRPLGRTKKVQRPQRSERRQR